MADDFGLEGTFAVARPARRRNEKAVDIAFLVVHRDLGIMGFRTQGAGEAKAAYIESSRPFAPRIQEAGFRVGEHPLVVTGRDLSISRYDEEAVEGPRRSVVAVRKADDCPESEMLGLGADFFEFRLQRAPIDARPVRWTDLFRP
nr:hypothetical protein [Fulvimarina manganoxydans]